MKLTTLITASSITATAAFAGEPAPVQPAPAPAPTLGGWFVGGTFGMFESDSNVAQIAEDYANDNFGNGYEYYAEADDFEFEMYTLHIGRNLGSQFLGCDLAAYFEVGYITGDTSLGVFDEFSSFPNDVFTTGIDVDIIPITINLMAERALFADIKGYVSAGVGYAFTDSDSDFGSESDGGFYAQAQIGLAYDINENWEIYGGVRWLYLRDLDFGYDEEYISNAKLDNSFAYEIGARYTF